MHSVCHRTFPFVDFEYTRNWIADSKKRILVTGCWIDLTSRIKWRPDTDRPMLCRARWGGRLETVAKLTTRRLTQGAESNLETMKGLAVL